MYKIIVRDNQLFKGNETVSDIVAHFAERADLKTRHADMIFFRERENRSLSVITKKIADALLKQGISYDASARQYADEGYPYIDESEVDEYVKEPSKIDMPVVNDELIPQYVISEGYCKTDRSEHYICKVLVGISDYNLSINSDATVSCNCMLRRAGELGSIRNQTLKEIYDSKRVADMRQTLANGFLPTTSCWQRCTELMQVPKSVAEYYIHNYQVPKVLMYENSSLCNYKCKGCFNEYIDKGIGSIEDAKIVSREISANGIKTLHLFKYGEPFTDLDILEKVSILREENPDLYIVTSTNGMLLDREENIECALKLNKVIFSLDGVDDETISHFQVNGKFDAVYGNMTRLARTKHERGVDSLEIVWKYVLFPHNDSDEQIRKVFELAESGGIDKVEYFNGFNTETASSAIWKSSAFLEYMEKYRWEFRDGVYHYYLSRGAEQ